MYLTMGLEIAAIILSLIGALFLIFEVLRVQKFELAAIDLEEAKRLLALAKDNPKELWIIGAMTGKYTDRAKAEEMVKELTDEIILDAIDKDPGFRKAKASIARWETWTTPTFFRWRKRQVRTGLIMLIFAAIIQIASVVIKDTNQEHVVQVPVTSHS